MTTAASLPIRALLVQDDPHSRLDELCEFAPGDAADEEVVFWFVRLVAWLRPVEWRRVEPKVRFLEARLSKNPEWRARVARTVEALIERTELDRLLAYGAIPRAFHLGGAVREWLLHRALPTAYRTRDGAQILELAFNEGDAGALDRGPDS